MNNSSKGFCCVLEGIVQQRQWCDQALYQRPLLNAYPHVQNVNSQYLNHAIACSQYSLGPLSAVPSCYLLAGTLLMLLSHIKHVQEHCYGNGILLQLTMTDGVQ
jgi:hypothetical protein